MTNKRIANQHQATFDSTRQFDPEGNEYWGARDLQPLLEYAGWDKFKRVIEKAMEACRQSGYEVDDHFSQAAKMVDIGSGAQREIEDYRLSRYACYLIVQNGDPSKSVIANGQTYFALQTRRQELNDNEAFARLSENDKRLAIRNELAEHNKYLAAAAKDAGVETSLDYAIFQDQRFGGEGYSCSQEIEEEPEDTRPHGEYRAGCQPVPSHAGRRKVETGERAQQAAR